MSRREMPGWMSGRRGFPLRFVLDDRTGNWVRSFGLPPSNRTSRWARWSYADLRLHKTSPTITLQLGSILGTLTTWNVALVGSSLPSRQAWPHFDLQGSGNARGANRFELGPSENYWQEQEN